MKKLHFTSLSALLFIITLAFKGPEVAKISGTYGVSEDNPAQIKLILNEDYTYTYQDYSRPANKIELSGKWELKKDRTVFLISDKEKSFHQKWKISEDGQTAKSRNRLSFYTLRK